MRFFRRIQDLIPNLRFLDSLRQKTRKSGDESFRVTPNTGANRREANGLHTDSQGAFFPDLYPKKRTNLTNTISVDSLDSKSS